METNEALFDNCMELARNTGCKILIVDVLGTPKAYIVGDVRFKTRDISHNEVRGAQDITNLVGWHSVRNMTGQMLRENIQSIPVESFNFTTDEYLLIDSVK